MNFDFIGSLLGKLMLSIGKENKTKCQDKLVGKDSNNWVTSNYIPPKLFIVSKQMYQYTYAQKTIVMVTTNEIIMKQNKTPKSAPGGQKLQIPKSGCFCEMSDTI